MKNVIYMVYYTTVVVNIFFAVSVYLLIVPILSIAWKGIENDKTCICLNRMLPQEC